MDVLSYLEAGSSLDWMDCLLLRPFMFSSLGVGAHVGNRRWGPNKECTNTPYIVSAILFGSSLS